MNVQFGEPYHKNLEKLQFNSDFRNLAVHFTTDFFLKWLAFLKKNSWLNFSIVKTLPTRLGVQTIKYIPLSLFYSLRFISDILS